MAKNDERGAKWEFCKHFEMVDLIYFSQDSWQCNPPSTDTIKYLGATQT